MPASESPEPRPLKRKCDASSTAVSEFLPDAQLATRSDTVWFDDGNVILHVENILFRVHRGFVAANSGIFDDMFKMPQPRSDTSIEGCPVVRLHDALEDWETLLMTIYYPFKIHPSQKDLSSTHLISILRLGKKYQFDRIFEEALIRLKSEFPQTLDAYDTMFDDLHQNGPLRCQRDGPCPYMACTTWRLFDLTNAMLELGVQSTLPMALYLCAIRSGNTLFNGCCRPDNTSSSLSYDAQKIVFSNRDAFQDRELNRHWLLNSFPSPNCESVKCKMLATVMATTLKMNTSQSDGHPLYPVTDRQFGPFCDKCQHAKKWQKKERILFWRVLPRLFDLPDWRDLKD